MADLTPGRVFGKRMKEARESAGRVTQAELADRLNGLGVKLHRAAVAEIERGARKVTLDEALAISWALGVAPVYMFTPFENPTPKETEGGFIYEAPDSLQVADGLVMHPQEARAWIKGRSIRQTEGDFLRAWLRFYAEEVAPPVRERRAIRAHERYRASFEEMPLEPPITPTMVKRGGVPADAYMLLAYGGRPEDPDEEDHDGDE